MLSKSMQSLEFTVPNVKHISRVSLYFQHVNNLRLTLQAGVMVFFSRLSNITAISTSSAIMYTGSSHAPT